MSSSAPQPLTDRTALLRGRRRVRGDALFLLDEARAEIEDRLSMVNKAFKARAMVSGLTSYWQKTCPDWHHVADDDTLALPQQRFDLVVHAMALHWANDPVGQLIQCRRALKPDGLLLAVFPGGQSLHELRACLAEAETALRGGLSPRILPMSDIRDCGGLLQRAGLALPVADSLPIGVDYQTLPRLLHDLRYMGEGNALFARSRQFTPRALFRQAEALYAKAYPGTQAPLHATFELITLTGWAPDASQPQPLRPGSAMSRLADALGSDETSLPD